MPARTSGRYERTAIADEAVEAFVPYPLPPADPPLVLDARRLERIGAAERALARLDLAGELIPSLDWFIYAFVRKEAVLTSQIEGTQATLVDLLSFEASGASAEAAPDPDIEEVCNYLDAVSYARDQSSDPDGLPISMRLLNETHCRLMQGARGADRMPGEIRRSQNWVGGSRPGNAAFVPPPPNRLDACLSDLERFVHNESSLPPLVRTGLVHVQFETIHPYLDGNGRIGRLLVTLLLEHWQLLGEPLLYLSLHFKRHRAEYYRRLDAVRREGDWEGWIDFFLDGITTIADESVDTARELFALTTTDRPRVLEEAGTSVTAVRLFELLPRHPVVSISFIVDSLRTTKPTAGKAVESLVRAGVLFETTGRRRDRSWVYRDYLDRLRIGTEHGETAD